jgi:hypothetical protein
MLRFGFFRYASAQLFLLSFSFLKKRTEQRKIATLMLDNVWVCLCSSGLYLIGLPPQFSSSLFDSFFSVFFSSIFFSQGKSFSISAPTQTVLLKLEPN